MLETADHELLQQYAREDSEAAFAALVARHLNLVYSAALRKTGDIHAAEEVTQAVFIILARKADGLRRETILSGWLYQTARLTAINYQRTEIRRGRREQEAYVQSLSNEPESEVWKEIVPLLEDAMGRLSEKDRNAVVLRFFERKNFRDVGAAFGASENAAKKRVAHALEKLRRIFLKRGVASTTTILAAAISAHSVHAAPALLAKSATAAAMVKGAAAGGSTLTLIEGVLKLMAWTKMKTAIGVGAAVLLAGGTATITVKKIEEHRTYPWQVPHFSTAILNQVPPQVVIVPAKFPMGGLGWSNDKLMGIGQPLTNILPHVYGMNWARTVCNVRLPPGSYDFIANLPQGSADALRREIERKFGLAGRREVRETDVLRLTVVNANAPGLKPSAPVMAGAREIGSSGSSAGHFTCHNNPLSTLTGFLESCFQIPVVDQTGLNRQFDIDLNWAEQDWQHHNLEGLKEALRDQLGLELVSGRERIEMLVVEKSN